MSNSVRTVSALSLAFALGAFGCGRDEPRAAEIPARPADFDVRRDAALPSPTPELPSNASAASAAATSAAKTSDSIAARVSADAAASRAEARAAAARVAAANLRASNAAAIAAADARAAASARRSMTVAVGATLGASMQDSLSSRVNKPGEVVHAVLSENVMDGNGRVAIPAGASIALVIVKLEPGSDQVRPEGRLELEVSSVTINGLSYPLSATLGPIPHTMQGRGITKDEAARVAGGAAVGAIIGQVIGKNTKGTVIGAAAGTVVGGAAAARYAFRDVIVAAGARIVLTLTQPFVVTN
jgi:hypothetical protein